MEHALPRTWSLCMTSENHGTVGPAGCKFSHAPEKHERVLVVEVLTAVEPAEDNVEVPAQWLRNLAQLRPEAYSHNGLIVVTRAFCNTADDYSAGITPVFATPPATTGASTVKTIDTPEFRERLRGLGATFSAHGDAYKLLVGYVNRHHSVAAQAGQVAVPVEGQVAWSIDLQARLIAVSQDIAADDDARQVMAEAACLLAELTGAAPSPAKKSK